MDSSPLSLSIKTLDNGGLLHNYLTRSCWATQLLTPQNALIVKERKDNRDISIPREEGYQLKCQSVPLNYKTLSDPGRPTHLTLYLVWHTSYGWLLVQPVSITSDRRQSRDTRGTRGTAILSFLGFGHFRKQVQHPGETGHLHPVVKTIVPEETPWGTA